MPTMDCSTKARNLTSAACNSVFFSFSLDTSRSLYCLSTSTSGRASGRGAAWGWAMTSCSAVMMVSTEAGFLRYLSAPISRASFSSPGEVKVKVWMMMGKSCRCALADFVAEPVAVHARHEDVGDDCVNSLTLQQSERVHAVMGLEDRVAFELQLGAEQLQVNEMVVNDEEVHGVL